MSSLGEEMPAAIKRAREVRDQLIQCRGMANVIVEPQIMMLTHEIDQAIEALASGDVIAMLRAYEPIKDYRPFPSLDSITTHDARRNTLTAAHRMAKLDQAKRQRGRALLLVIKAKLESVESGIETLEQAFLAHVVMADGKTVHERIAEPIALEYQSGRPSAGEGLLMLPAR